ncbi:hypothetical protein DIZ81_10750 [Legionella taurinensis]|uniref:HNH nuclease domain-containing protein n=1 Tax=Legionella taurinensis TaxID=70611 RepID=A0A3A5L9D9_9GAMM|nr:HNH endonuclease [Legionella taurinensis]MDX1838326.1 HNH endonuclease [Legionella taurinensis]PUT39091.1 hypothetical protein DB744_10760 [Legionella taurinensis]PUT39545.1 hypothetical protein DB746_13415 [Legionella taurinensis]PUT43547.1 hypothetical protein DB743_10150 [Legionella taurinensis]PUT45201.1 hypothetical protein DB745_13355 [Legionella taurinensis]
MALRDTRKVVLVNYIGQFRSALRFNAYHSSRPPTNRESGHRRRARIKSAGGQFDDYELGKLYTDVKGYCYWCGQCTRNKMWHADHYVPLALGGPNCIENIVISCPTCNFKKGAQDPIGFAKKINKQEGEEKRELIFAIAKINRKQYEDNCKKIRNKPLVITVCYLDRINAYGFMFSQFNRDVMHVFNSYYEKTPSQMMFNHYSSGFGQNVWLIDKSVFDLIFNTLIGLNDKNIKFQFIRIITTREQSPPSSDNFLTPIFTRDSMRKQTFAPASSTICSAENVT